MIDTRLVHQMTNLAHPHVSATILRSQMRTVFPLMREVSLRTAPISQQNARMQKFDRCAKSSGAPGNQNRVVPLCEFPSHVEATQGLRSRVVLAQCIGTSAWSAQ